MEYDVQRGFFPAVISELHYSEVILTAAWSEIQSS